MLIPTITPKWETLGEHLQTSLGYTETTLNRTKYTYNIFVRQYCGTEGEAKNRIEAGIEQIANAYEAGTISRDKLLRLRRVAFRMLQLLESGEITWVRSPRYGKRFGNTTNESILASFLDNERNGHKHSESIIERDKNILRQYILYAESHGFDITAPNSQNIIGFLAHMKTLRPAGIQSIVSALRHFYRYMVDTGEVNSNILLSIRSWDTPKKKVYGIFTAEEKQKLLNATESWTQIQENVIKPL